MSILCVQSVLPSCAISRENILKTQKALKMGFYKNGGGRWIRTIEVEDNRFTVCPLWPLGNPSICWLKAFVVLTNVL